MAGAFWLHVFPSHPPNNGILILHVRVDEKRLRENGKLYPWPRRCPRCGGRLWGHGYVPRYFEDAQALRDEGLAGTSRINVIRVHGFNIGGPFVKDKAWFYGSYGVQDIQNISRFNMPRKTILEMFLAKMNFQIVPQNRLEIFAEGKGKLKVGTDPDTFNPKGYDRPGLQHFGYPVFRIQDEHMFGAKVFASLKFGYWGGGSLTRIPSHKFLYTISETGYFQGVVKLPPRRFADPLRGATPPPSNSPAVMRLTGFYLIQGISETHHWIRFDPPGDNCYFIFMPIGMERSTPMIRALRLPIFFSMALLVSFILAPAAAHRAQEADRVYVNGTVYTVDKAFSKASAMAVKDGRFIFVGDEAGAKAYMGPLTLVFDLKGQTVIPGLHDAHVHIQYGERTLYPRTPDIRAKIGEWASVKRMQEVIKRCLATGEGMRPGPEPRWLVLRGWMSDVWDPPEFRKELIDAVAPDNPVYISRSSHGSGANSKALELAGITRDTPDPPGGHIKKDKNGEPTGEFVESDPAQLTRLIPPLPPMTDFEISRNLVEGTQLAVASGLTTIHGANMTGYEEVQRRIKLYEVGLLRIRINEMVREDAAKKLGKPLNVNNKYFVRSVKAFADGALGSRGALLLKEYSDYPGFLGEPRQSENELAQSATELLKIGFNVRTHCIGDAANRIAINAYERALKATGTDGKKARFALEHCQVLSPEDIPRLAKLGIVASMQPLHATEDKYFAESRLGPERIKHAYIWRTLLDLGVVIATGTDYPSPSPYNPFYTLHAAVTRQDRDNNPPGGWFPKQAMTREEALRAATMGGAYVMFAEDILGSIEVGKLADFVVIPVDYMTIPAKDIWKIEPEMTVIGGEIVYKKRTS